MKKAGAQLIAVFAVCFLGLDAVAAKDPFLLLTPTLLTNNQLQILLQGEPDVPYVIETSPDAQSWTPALTNTESSGVRLMEFPATNGPVFFRAGRGLLPVFSAAITARQLILFPVSSVLINSYDFDDPAHDNPLDPLEAKAGGDIQCEGNILPGGSTIHGIVRTPATLASSNAIIGDLSWTNVGVIQPGWFVSQYRFVSPDVAPPFVSGFALPPGTGTNYTTLLAADYLVPGDLKPTGSQKVILVVGSARLWVKGDFALPNSWSIRIMPGAALKLYVGDSTGSAVIAQIGLVEVTSTFGNSTFQFYGLPSNTQVSWTVGNTFSGFIYAPQASVTLGGGGISPYDFAGACVADQVTINAHVNFHYNEKLKRAGPKR